MTGRKAPAGRLRSKDKRPTGAEPGARYPAQRARYTAHAVRHTKATPAQLADYLAGFHARGQGAWPSQRHLAHRFGVCVRTIQRWLRDLLDAELVLIDSSKPYQDRAHRPMATPDQPVPVPFQNETARTKGKDQVRPRRHFCRLYVP